MTEEFFLERDGIKLHGIDHGGDKNPILLLVHGAAAHAKWWDFVAPHYTDNFRPVAMDLRGHGDSDWAEDYSYDDFAKDLEFWIDWAYKETNKKPFLLAHSMGGGISLRLTASKSPNITSMIVVDSPFHINERILKEMNAFGSRPSRPWVSLELFIKKFRMIPASGKAKKEHLEHIAKHSVRQLQDGTWLLKADRSFHSKRGGSDLVKGWLNLNVPGLLVIGELSDRITSEDIEWAKQNLKNVQIKIIKGAHHHVYIDDPNEFIKVTKEFLNSMLSLKENISS